MAENDRHADSLELINAALLACREMGHDLTASALLSGVPEDAEGLSPEGLLRALHRHGFTAVSVSRRIRDLGGWEYPALMATGRGYLVLCRRHGKRVEVKAADGYRRYLSCEELERERKGPLLLIGEPPATGAESGNSDPGRHWLLAALWRYRGAYAAVVLASVLVNLFALVGSVLIMLVYDRVIPNNAMETLAVLAAGAAGAYVFDFLIKTARAYLVDAAGRGVERSLAAAMLERALGRKLALRDADSGTLAARLREFETVRDFFTSASLLVFVDLPFLFVFLLLIWLLAGPVVYVPLIAVALVIASGLLLQMPMRRSSRAAVQGSLSRAAFLVETMAGLATLKLNNAEGRRQRLWERLVDRSAAAWVKARALSSLGVNITGFIQGLMSIGVIAYGAVLAGRGEISLGAVIAAVILAGRAMSPLMQFAGIMSRFQQARAALAQLDQVMLAPQERPPGRRYAGWCGMGEIVFDNVGFRYPGQERAALQEISLKIEQGERIGIIGGIGAGKTTLVKLLAGLHEPDEGAIMLGGLDVRQIDPADLRATVALAEQEPFLFHGSIRENILLGAGAVDITRLREVLALSGADRFLGKGENGLEMPVGERGATLSSGQRQAIALARCLLRDAPVLVMDEPAAAFDPGSETRFRDRLAAWLGGRTLVLISHRNTMLQLVDRLVVLEKGRIIADGPRDKVIAGLLGGAAIRRGKRGR